MGIASFVMAFFPAALLVGGYWLVLFLASQQPPGADETGYGAGVILLVLMTLLAVVAALGLGIAGALQRRRKRLFAFRGISCSILALAAIFAQDKIFPAWALARTRQRPARLEG